MSFVASYDSSALWTETPGEELWRSLCDTLLKTPAAAVPASSRKRLDTFVEVLVGELGLSSVYLLVDGVDGFFETATDPRAAVALIDPLLAHVTGWAQHRLFLKAFLPAEVAPALETGHLALLRTCRRADMKWFTPLLADVIRRRVFIATEGAFSSLDALSTPELTDVETQLARAVTPLPREALVLTGRLLWEHARRSNGADKLDVADLEVAMRWYEGQRPVKIGPMSHGLTPPRRAKERKDDESL